MGGSSTGDPIYQCGTHDYETNTKRKQQLDNIKDAGLKRELQTPGY